MVTVKSAVSSFQVIFTGHRAETVAMAGVPVAGSDASARVDDRVARRADDDWAGVSVCALVWVMFVSVTFV